MSELVNDGDSDEDEVCDEDDVACLDAEMEKLTLKVTHARERGDREKINHVLEKVDEYRSAEAAKLQEKLDKYRSKLKTETSEDKIRKLKKKVGKVQKKKAAVLCGAGCWHDVDATTEGHVRVASLPEDVFRFVESTAYNATFDPVHVYIPVQHADETCHIYKLDVKDGVEPLYLCEVRLHHKNDADGHDELTPFGCCLTDAGVLFICMFNVNLVLGWNLVTNEPVGQIKCPAPNDVCISSCGHFLKMGCGSRLGKVTFGGGAGTIWTSPIVEPFESTCCYENSQGTMAGIEEKDGVIYCTHLERMTAYRPEEKSAERIWTGRACDDDQFYLADNLAWWTPTALLTPCYRQLAAPVAEFLDEHAAASAVAWGGARALTFVKRLAEGGLSGILKANAHSSNPECDLSLSKGDLFPHVHLAVYDVVKKTSTNFRLITDDFEGFDGHVTHAQPAAGHVVLVNFTCHKLMIVKDEAFGPHRPS